MKSIQKENRNKEGYMRKLFIFLIGVGIAFPLYIYLGQIYSLGFLLAYFLYTALRDI